MWLASTLLKHLLKKKDVAMVINNYTKPDNITLAG
jgi:hypothetical protein